MLQINQIHKTFNAGTINEKRALQGVSLQLNPGDFVTVIGGKTGTSQVNNAEDNGIFVAFAPFDHPQIAISVILENGGHGSNAGPVVRDILDAYFFSKSSADDYDLPFIVLD